MQEQNKPVVEQIGDIIDQYESIGQGLDIDNLLNMRDRLAQLAFRFAEETGELKGKYNMNYFIRKITVSNRVQGLIKANKFPKNKAETMAESENEDLFKKEIEANSQAYKADLLLKQVNKVLDAMQQRLSHMKNEWEKENSNGGINPLIKKLLEYLEKNERQT